MKNIGESIAKCNTLINSEEKIKITNVGNKIINTIIRVRVSPFMIYIYKYAYI